MQCTIKRCLTVTLTGEQKSQLFDTYRLQPAYDDVGEVLADLHAAGFRAEGGRNTGLLHRVVSVHDLSSFKPNPAVYRYFLRKSGQGECLARFMQSIRCHWCDFGLKAVWLRCFQDAIFEPWVIEPTVNLSTRSNPKGLISWRRSTGWTTSRKTTRHRDLLKP